MPLRSDFEPGTSRWATFVEAQEQRLRCTLPRRQSWGLPELEDLRGVAEALAGRVHEWRLVVVAQVSRRHAQGRAAGAAGFQHEERIGAVSALPDQLPGAGLVAAFLHQARAADGSAAAREADAQAAARVRHLGEPPPEDLPPLRRPVGRVPVAVVKPQLGAWPGGPAWPIHA